MPPESPRARTFPTARLRPARSFRVAAGLVAFWAAMIAAICIFLPELRGVVGIPGTLVLALMIAGFRRLAEQTPRGGGQLEVRGGDLYVEGRLALPRARLERAVVARDARGVNVSIQTRKTGASMIDVGSEAEGHALVKALGLDAAQSLSTFVFDSPLTARLPAWLYALQIASFFPVILLPIALRVWWMLPLGLVWYASLIGGLVPERLSIGLDGLLVRWLWRRELIRFDGLRGVEHDGQRLHLTLADGRRRSLSVRWTGSPFQKSDTGDRGFASRSAYLDAVVARVREALDASRGEAGHLHVAGLLRRGRALDAWVSALRGTLSRGPNGFREPEPEPARLWSTVEDGGADPTARAVAAIALGPTLDDAERQRLRGVARVVVSPRLRVALEAAAADDDDEGVREALAALEQEREASAGARTRQR